MPKSLASQEGGGLGGEGLDPSPLPERHERPGHEGDAPTPLLRAAHCDSSTGASDCICTARWAIHNNKLRAADARDQNGSSHMHYAERATWAEHTRLEWSHRCISSSLLSVHSHVIER